MKMFWYLVYNIAMLQIRILTDPKYTVMPDLMVKKLEQIWKYWYLFFILWFYRFL